MPDQPLAKRSLRARQQALMRQEELGLPTDREELASVLLETAHQLLRIRRMPVLLDATDDVASYAAGRASRAHDKDGHTIVKLFRGEFALFVESAAVDVARRAGRLPRPLTAFEREDGHNPLMELPDAAAPALDAQVDTRDELRGVIAAYRSLDEFLAAASDKVRLIGEMAIQGHKRKDIAEAVSARLGERVSDASVRAVIARQFNVKFPNLRHLWDAKETSGTSSAERKYRAQRAARREAANEAFEVHLSAARPLVKAIAAARHKLGARRSDWVAVATIVQANRERMITSTEVCRTWDRWVAALPDEARHADR